MKETTVQKDREVPRCDTLTDRQLEAFGRNYRLVCLIESGLTTRVALNRLVEEYRGLNFSKRWAERIYKRYKEQGAAGLLDHRYQRKTDVLIFTKEVKDITLALWYARPAAGPKAIWKKVVEHCSEKNLATPGYDVIKKFLKAMPEHDKLVRAGKIKVWDKQARPVVRMNLTSYSNERWQIDHCSLPIWIREQVLVKARNGVMGETRYVWIPRTVWLTLLLDAHSRAIAGFYLSKKAPDAWSTSVALRHAILRKENPAWRVKGVPAIIQPDCGKDFLSHAVAASLAYLGIILDPDPPHYPQRKGRIERFFRTLNDGCLRILPGHHAAVGVTVGAAQKHVASLLTRQQLQREIERFITTDYHVREHSETGRKPLELWEETVRLRMPQSEDALDAMLLKSDKARRVRHTGVDFHLPGKAEKEMRGGRYWMPELTYHWNSKVQIRYNPEDLTSILCYSETGEYIGEAWRLGYEDSRYHIGDIKRNRSQFRRGLLERQQEYAAEIHEYDRRAARQEEWNAARELDNKMAEDPVPEPDADDMNEVEWLLAEFEKRDRGL
jgi:putative transposase